MTVVTSRYPTKPKVTLPAAVTAHVGLAMSDAPLCPAADIAGMTLGVATEEDRGDRWVLGQIVLEQVMPYYTANQINCPVFSDSSVQFSFVLHPFAARYSHWMWHSVEAQGCG